MTNLKKVCDIVNAQTESNLKYALNNVTNHYGFIKDMKEIINDEFDHDAIKERRVFDYFYESLLDDLVIYSDLFDDVDLEDKEDEEDSDYEKHFRRFK